MKAFSSSSFSDTEPLAQRTSGRRAQRRQMQIQQPMQVETLTDSTAQQQSNNDNSNSNVCHVVGMHDNDDETLLIQRGPSQQRENQIQAAIERRKQILAKGMMMTFQEEILGNYEYLDHTADVQLHSWGTSLENALQDLVMAMFGYMTQLSSIIIQDDDSYRFGAHVHTTGQDLQSMVFHFLQEWLCIFHETGFVAKQVVIQAFDRDKFTVDSYGQGECVDWNRHAQGTEIKAVTYSNLQVVEDPGRCDIYVIVDI